MIKKIALLIIALMLSAVPAISVFADDAVISVKSASVFDDGSFEFEISARKADIRIYAVTYTKNLATGYIIAKDTKITSVAKGSSGTVKISPPADAGDSVKLIVLDTSLKSVLKGGAVFEAMVYPYVSNLLTENLGYTLTDTGIDQNGYSYSEYDIGKIMFEEDVEDGSETVLSIQRLTTLVK